MKQFLPQIQEANSKLYEEITTHPDSQSKYDLESTEGVSGPLVEMVHYNLIHFLKEIFKNLFNVNLQQDLAVYEESGSDTRSDSEESPDDLPNEGPVDESNIKIPGSTTKTSSNLVEEI